MRTCTLFVITAAATLSACASTPSAESPQAAALSASPLLQTCPAASPTRMECLERELLDTLRVEGIAQAMATLERIGAVDEQIRRDGHVYAHVIGLAAYSTPEEVGASFAECTPAFQSGCYHGVIQSYFVDVSQGGGPAVDAETVNALCSDYRAEGEAWLLFQCAHGMGHGLTMVSGYHLPRALEACDLVASPWEREACFGGVFMESIVNATAPHHTTGRPDHGGGHAHGAASADEAAGADHSDHAEHAADHSEHMQGDSEDVDDGHAEHAQHDMADAAEDFPPLNPDDSHYPCSVLAERYQDSCYMMQTSVVLHFSGGDFAAAAEMCDAAPGAFRESCYRSLGRDASSYAIQNHAEGLRLCSVPGEDERSWCQIGYVKNVIDVTADPGDGIEFCRMVPGGTQKERCYRAVGEQVWVLARNDEQRAAYCDASEAAYVEHCRAGADLIDARSSSAAP